MSKDNNGSGLLSKMAQIVKRPSEGWNDLDAQQAGHRDSQYSKQVLAEMIERKRRNDFVRKREFDMLRKLRNRINEVEQIQGGRPSFFQSSYSSKPDDDNRASTLKKINEIEEQMAQQWWRKTHHDGGGNQHQEPPPPLIEPEQELPPRVPPRARPVPAPAQRDPSGGAGSAMERTQQLPRMGLPPRQQQGAPGQGMAGGNRPVAPNPTLPPVRPISSPTFHAPIAAPPPQQRPAPTRATPHSSHQTAQIPRSPAAMPASPASASHMTMDTESGTSALFIGSNFSVDVQEPVLNPYIEEAAIRFASGDDAAAEQGLLNLLKRDQAGTIEEWLALFDLYRAIGNADAFESLAIDFANRFSTSAPQWFSMKAELAARGGGMSTQSTSTLGKATWVADKVLEPYAVTVLTKTLERTPQPWVLDWTALEKIDPGAVSALVQLFKNWVRNPIDLRFVSAIKLRDCLQQAAVSGNTSTDRIWWELRLLALRTMNMGDEFEMVALDYCVTYEESPPSWEPPVCHFRSLHPGEAPASNAPAEGKSQPLFVESQLNVPSILPDSETGGFPLSQPSLDWPMVYLEGEIFNDAQPALDAIDKQLEGASVLAISCEYLIRVDFSAAGNILNWSSAHQREGREVRFTHVHRLVAAFFHVVGVTESAKVVLRTG